MILRQKQVEIQNLKNQVECQGFEIDYLKEDWSRVSHEVLELQSTYKEMEEKSEQAQADAREFKENAEKQLEHDKVELTKQIDAVQKRIRQYKTYFKKELQVQEAISAKYKHQMEVYKANINRFRAILRVPRLCRIYHEAMRERENVEDLDIIDNIYKEHFANTAKELDQLDDNERGTAAE